MGLEITIHTGAICLTLHEYQALLRPLVYPFIESWKDSDENLVKMGELHSRVIKRREQGDENINILQWLIAIYKRNVFDILFRN